MFTLAEVFESLERPAPAGSEGVDIRGAQIDSRLDVRDRLFVAIRTKSGDGNQFVADAFRQGAAAAIVNQASPDWPQDRQVVVDDSVEALGRLGAFVRRRATGTVVIGVTGSNGKTTTKEALAAALSAAGRVVKSERSFNNELGVPITLAELGPDTDFAVLEMGAQVKGEIAAYCRLARPDAGVICNVGRAHIGLFGSEQGVAVAKAELAEAVGSQGVVALNRDDAWSSFIRERTAARVFWFGGGEGEGATGWSESKSDLSGSVVTVIESGQRAVIEVAAVGRGLGLSFAAAVALGRGVGVEFGTLVDGLKGFRTVPHRMQVIRVRGAAVIDDSYNANRDSVLYALDEIKRARCDGRRLAVLGEMLELGEFAEADHQTVGARAAWLDGMITVGRHAKIIGDEAAKAGADPAAIRHIPCDVEDPGSVRAAVDGVIGWLAEDLRPGDLVLIKGSNALGLHRIAEALSAG